MASVLKDLGVQKGDRVTIYMPMIPEAVYAMQACARIGAIFSVIFGGFSPEAIAGRIRDAASDFVITADQGRRGGKTVALKANVDAALQRIGADGPEVRHVLVVQNTGGNVTWDDDLDVWYHEAAEAAPAECPCEPMDAEDPLSSSTPRARPARRRASSTRPRATASTRRSRTSSRSTSTTTTSSGAPPTSAGSPATATSPSGR